MAVLVWEWTLCFSSTHMALLEADASVYNCSHGLLSIYFLWLNKAKEIFRYRLHGTTKEDWKILVLSLTFSAMLFQKFGRFVKDHSRIFHCILLEVSQTGCSVYCKLVKCLSVYAQDTVGEKQHPSEKAYPREVGFRFQHTRVDGLVFICEGDHVEDHRLWHGQDDG